MPRFGSCARFGLAVLLAVSEGVAGQSDFTGQVQDAASGRPIVGATVRLLSSDSSVLRATLTEADGSFVLPDLDVARTLQVSAYGYQSHSILLPADPQSGVGLIRLEPSAIELAGFEVAATVACEAAEDPFAAVSLLQSLSGQLLEVGAQSRRSDMAYVMQYVVPKKTWVRQNWWFEPDTSLVAWDAAIPTASVESYSRSGFAEVLNDSTSVYLAPSMAYLASADFQASHCFSHRTGGASAFIDFEPKVDLGSRVGISGTIEVRNGNSVVEVSWRYENLEPFVRESEVPQWERAYRERYSEYESITFLPLVDRGETGGFIRIAEVSDFGAMIVQWEIRGVHIGSSGGEGKAESTPGFGLRYTTLTTHPTVRGLFPTEARLVALRPRQGR